MEHWYSLNIIGNGNDLGKNPESFTQFSDRKYTGPSDFNVFNIFPLNSLSIILIPGAKFDGQRGIWTVCKILLF